MDVTNSNCKPDDEISLINQNTYSEILSKDEAVDDEWEDISVEFIQMKKELDYPTIR
jgi:hypothetical protein